MLQNADPNLRSTQQVVQVLFSEGVAPTPGTEYLTAEIETSSDLSAELEIPLLTTNITTSATVQANISGIRTLAANISATGIVQADAILKVPLTSTIVTSATVVAELRENIEYLTSDIAGSGTITSAKMDVPWKPGSTLVVQHNANVNIIKLENLTDTVDLQQTGSLIFGQRALSAQATVAFSDVASATKVLPVKTASDTLSLTDAATANRPTESFLVLTQAATGTISFLEGIASDNLSLTDSATLASSVFTLAIENLINLTQSATVVQITDKVASSTLDLNQNAFAVALGSKKYVLLQAPFELIQTSVVLPNPLLDDNESLVSNLTLRRSMNNTARTYVKTSRNRRLRYTFTLSRLKSIELERFFDSYNGADIKLLNWKGEIWKVNLITNPLDFVQTRRAEPGGDRTDVNLELEGTLLNG